MADLTHRTTIIKFFFYYPQTNQTVLLILKNHYLWGSCKNTHQSPMFSVARLMYLMRTDPEMLVATTSCPRRSHMGLERGLPHM